MEPAVSGILCAGGVRTSIHEKKRPWRTPFLLLAGSWVEDCP